MLVPFMHQCHRYVFHCPVFLISPLTRHRLGNGSSSYGHTTSGLFTCAICQSDLAASEGISVHAGSIFSTSSKPWQGPFLCAACRNKKDAMEGKRPSGVKVLQLSSSHFSIKFYSIRYGSLPRVELKCSSPICLFKFSFFKLIFTRSHFFGPPDYLIPGSVRHPCM